MLLKYVDAAIVNCDYLHLAVLAADHEQVRRARDAPCGVVLKRGHALAASVCLLGKQLLRDCRTDDAEFRKFAMVLSASFWTSADLVDNQAMIAYAAYSDDLGQDRPNSKFNP